MEFECRSDVTGRVGEVGKIAAPGTHRIVGDVGKMERKNNYLIQAAQAKERFLTYDQQRLIEKFRLDSDAQYFYVNLLCKQYRINRTTGDMERRESSGWQDANSHEEVMTLLDLLCDSREDRWISGRWKNMQSFGLQFHQNLLEDRRDPAADRFDAEPQRLREACRRLNGEFIPGGDIGFSVELFDGLRIGVLFWAGDEEFAPRLRYLWDENALMYIRYETMYFAVKLLLRRLLEGSGTGAVKNF